MSFENQSFEVGVFLEAFVRILFSAALAGGATPTQTPPLLSWFSFFSERSSANFVKKIQKLAEDKAENPRTC